MSRNFFLYRVAVVVLLLITVSCSVQKRKYQKGFYFASIHKPFQVNNNAQAFVSTTATADSCATIYFTDGTSIKGNIIEINAKDIFYRYCIDDGKEHKSSKLRLKSITYANGRVENFEPNTRPDSPQPISVIEPKTIQVDTVKGVAITSSQPNPSAATAATASCDVIIFKDGTEEDVQVKEVNDENVRYKLCSMLDGPDFVKSKDRIFMIKYRNGAKDIFTETNSYPQVKTVNQNSDPNFKPREGLATASLTASILGIYPIWVLGSVVGLILGLLYLQKNRINPKLYPEVKAARAGVIIALIMLALEALVVIALLSLI